VELVAVVRRDRRCKWIAGIKVLVISLNEALPVQLIRSRLGQYLDAAVAEFVVFGGKWILIDANLADCRLGGQLPAAEAVDVNLAAVRPGRRSCQRSQFVR